MQLGVILRSHSCFTCPWVGSLVQTSFQHLRMTDSLADHMMRIFACRMEQVTMRKVIVSNEDAVWPLCQAALFKVRSQTIKIN